MLRSDGNLYFIGRVDRQVKLRGYRIELGEIEASLLSAKGVQQAAAKLIDQDGKKNIHAWVAGRPEQDAENLKRLLRTRLPDYMLPASIDILPALPSSTSGKIDYNALPEPVPLQQAMARREPRNELERDLLSIWETVLRRKIGVRDNFFDLGGDSLAAIQILARIERLRGDTASLHLLIEHPTVEQLATALEGHSASHKLLVQLGEDRGRVPVFLAASGHGDLLRFQNLARALEDVCDLHMLQPPEAGGIAIDALAELYADRVEARSSSACYLAGFSVGGIAALETSRLLQERGNRVRGLFLIDTIYPGSLLGRAMPWRTVGWLTRNLRLQELSMNGRKLGAMFSDAGLVAQINALRRYRPGEFSGPTHLIKSSGLAHWDRWLFRSWRGLMPTNLSELQVPGLHGSMFEPANVQNLAAAIASRLESAEGKPAPRP